MMRITKKQFEYYLYQYKLDGILYSYKSVDLDDTYEYVYRLRINGCYDAFYLYSSIDKGSGISRDYGDDRIRCVVELSDGSYKRIFRINRTKGWQDRLKKGSRTDVMLKL